MLIDSKTSICLKINFKVLKHFLLFVLDPSAPVVNLTSVTATSIAIGWTSQAGTFLTTVRILRADGSATESNINVENNGDFFNAEGTSALISNLQAGTEYNISVTAFSTVKRSETTVLTQITGENLLFTLNFEYG